MLPCEQGRAVFCYGNASVEDDVKETPIRSGSHHHSLMGEIYTSTGAELTGKAAEHVITQECEEVEGEAGGGLFSWLQLYCLNL